MVESNPWAQRLIRYHRSSAAESTHEYRTSLVPPSRLVRAARIISRGTLMVFTGFLLAVGGSFWVSSDVLSFEAQDPYSVFRADQGNDPFTVVSSTLETPTLNLLENEVAPAKSELIPALLRPQRPVDDQKWGFPSPFLSEGSAPSITIVPERLLIPAIDLDAPIQSVDFLEFKFDERTYLQWMTPDEFAVGWHNLSAALGSPGNTVLNGHHNVHGEVFRNLGQVEEGDLIVLIAGDQVRRYKITEKMVLPEKDQTMEVRVRNAEWIQPTDDERVTLVTCWPYSGNSDRLIVIGKPETNLDTDVE
jgi:LPXTG-site transpeptidase (sortase) family protein